MSQSSRDAAVDKIMETLTKPKGEPLIEFGLFVVPDKGISRESPATKAALAMLRRGEQMARVTYKSIGQARSAGSSLINYGRRNGLAIEVAVRGCCVYITPTSKP